MTEDYFALKRRKAEEQGKTWWFEAVLTDEEANLRPTRDSKHSCLFCKRWNDVKHKCDKGRDVATEREQTCDEWRYTL